MIEAKKSRPYWHVDAKWICGLLLVVMLGAGLFAVGLYRLTERSSAQALTGAIATTFFINPNADVSANEVRHKLQPLYDQGLGAIAETASPDPKKQAEITKQLRPLALLTNDAHSLVYKIILGISIATLILTGGLIFFSRRFGKLVSVGVVLLVLALPGTLLFLTFQSGGATNGMHIGSIGPPILTLIASAFLPGYAIALAMAAGLLVLSGVLKLIRR
ncbi:MAG TPA: hypothetical protein VF272_00970 [Candidatus Saccharimonadia bacterium]